MSRRGAVPDREGPLYLTDGGIETTLIFREGLDLPAFAAFDLLASEAGTERLRRYYRPYLEHAQRLGTGFVLESPTWRASTDWGAEVGYSPGQVRIANRKAISLMEELRDEWPDVSPLAISGCVGPRGDGYDARQRLTVEEAREYHADQIDVFADAGADLVAAITMTHPEEAAGVAEAAAAAAVPAVISFTVETDGRLPSGHALEEAVRLVDVWTDSSPSYYMINCAHPEHFRRVVESGGDWRERIGGVRANASRKSHAELDEATELDEGEPSELARGYAALVAALPALRVVGGCCGTDERHVEAIGEVLVRA